jgi:hypothetical protein
MRKKPEPDHALALYGQRIGFGLITLVFIYTTLANMIERPDGIIIASIFIGCVMAISFTSRFMRSDELRLKEFRFADPADRMLWTDIILEGAFRVLVPHRPGSRSLAEKEAEIRLETYLAIVHGARGVVWWACCYCKHDHPRNWEATKRLAGELSRISPILLDKDAAQAVVFEPADAPIDVRLKQHAGKRYLLAVNHSPQPTGQVSFRLPDVKACRSYFDGSPRAVGGESAFGDTFEAYGVRLYEVE